MVNSCVFLLERSYNFCVLRMLHDHLKAVRGNNLHTIHTYNWEKLNRPKKTVMHYLNHTMNIITLFATCINSKC